jgi:hypothetical protein
MHHDWMYTSARRFLACEASVFFVEIGWEYESVTTSIVAFTPAFTSAALTAFARSRDIA